MFHRRLAHACGIVVLALAAVACQSSRVASFEKFHDLGPGDTVRVEPFDVAAVVWVGDQGEHSPQEVQEALRLHLVDTLRQGGMEVREDSTSVIRGTITLVDAGSGSARVWWGFGAGKSRLACTAEMFDGSISTVQPAYVVHVEGGSHGKAGVFAGGYLSIGDAKDAAEQIARFYLDRKPKR